MQVNKPFVVECIYKGTNKISRLDSFIEPEELINFGPFVSTLKHVYGKPIGFKFIELNVPINNPKFIAWLQYKFKYFFNYDPFMWLVSVSALPKELQPYLKDFHDRR